MKVSLRHDFRRRILYFDNRSDYKSQEKGSFHQKLNDRNYPPSFKLENLNQNSMNVTLTQRQNTLEKSNTQVEHCIGNLLLFVVFPPAPNWISRQTSETTTLACLPRKQKCI
jgi:hypothetical protein